MKKYMIISAIAIIAIIVIVFVISRNNGTTSDYDEFANNGVIHDDFVDTIDEYINISLIDVESIPDDILEICRQQCREYCILNGIQDETFMYYDNSETEYVFKSVTSDTYITVNVGGQINE